MNKDSSSSLMAIISSLMCYILWSTLRVDEMHLDGMKCTLRWMAYDTAWRYGVLQKVHMYGLRGQLPLFLAAFLCDRSIRVRVGNILSDVTKPCLLETNTEWGVLSQ